MTGRLGRALREPLDAALLRHGLMTRGGLHDEGRTIVLIGHAGGSIWPHFDRWRAGDRTPEAADPLDRWSRTVIEPVATRFGAESVFPFDRPYRPFQQWAMQAEGLRASPLGILVHPEYGLWHAYRGALVFDAVIALEPADSQSHPCDTCDEMPCLRACPVDAFDAAGFDRARCRGFLASDAGAGCMARGCAARLACPVGRNRAYGPDQQRFHMAAFASA